MPPVQLTNEQTAQISATAITVIKTIEVGF
jgi:hypothetical protein